MNDNDKTKTELVMKNVHLRRKMAEAEQKLEWAKGNVSIRDSEGNIYERVVELRDAAVWRLNRELESARADRQRLMAEVAELNGKLADRVPRRMYEKAEKSAARRLRHIDGVVNAIRKRNWYIDVLKGRVKELEFNNSQLGEQLQGLIDAGRAGTRGLTDRERRILDMWPRFEDGEPVMVGDIYADDNGTTCVANSISIDAEGGSVVDGDGFHDSFHCGKRVKRPANDVLDADGVQIRVGDTVFHKNGKFGSRVVADFAEHDGKTFAIFVHDGTSTLGCEPNALTHREPDSWERLEEDARQLDIGLDDTTDDYPRMRCVRDIVRRAKALAGIEVG